MKCGRCGEKMILHRFVGGRENDTGFIYECENCGIILEPNFITAISDKLFKEFLMFKENSNEYMCPYCRDCKKVFHLLFGKGEMKDKIQEIIEREAQEW